LPQQSTAQCFLNFTLTVSVAVWLPVVAVPLIFALAFLPCLSFFLSFFRTFFLSLALMAVAWLPASCVVVLLTAPLETRLAPLFAVAENLTVFFSFCFAAVKSSVRVPGGASLTPLPVRNALGPPGPVLRTPVLCPRAVGVNTTLIVHCTAGPGGVLPTS